VRLIFEKNSHTNTGQTSARASTTSSWAQTCPSCLFARDRSVMVEHTASPPHSWKQEVRNSYVFCVYGWTYVDLSDFFFKNLTRTWPIVVVSFRLGTFPKIWVVKMYRRLWFQCSFGWQLKSSTNCWNKRKVKQIKKFWISGQVVQIIRIFRIFTDVSVPLIFIDLFYVLVSFQFNKTGCRSESRISRYQMVYGEHNIRIFGFWEKFRLELRIRLAGKVTIRPTHYQKDFVWVCSNESAHFSRFKSISNVILTRQTRGQRSSLDKKTRKTDWKNGFGIILVKLWWWS